MFVLEPLYKLYSEVLCEQKDTLRRSLQGLGIKLNSTVYNLDTRSLLRVVVDRFFGSATALIDVIATWIPSPVRNAKSKVWVFKTEAFLCVLLITYQVEHTYFGPRPWLTLDCSGLLSILDCIITNLLDDLR